MAASTWASANRRRASTWPRCSGVLALADDGAFDDPLGESTGAAQIFAASGGVMEAPALEWQPLRGIGPGIRTAQIDGLGTVAICNGIAAAQHLLETQAWRDQFVAIEVMACVGGCLGGGGEQNRWIH